MNTANLAVVGPADQIAPMVPQTTEIIRAAVATGDVEMYREAVKLAKDLDAIAARKAFDNAMADAKAEIPTIRRNREVNAGGRGPAYKFEDLAEIARTIDPILAKHGLNYRFRTTQDSDKISVTCIVSHRSGHFEENTLVAGPDNGPGRNAIQQIGSTQTYLQRYTLKAALGLAASHDDDARNADSGADTGITALQMKELEALIKEVNANEERVCKACHVETLAEMTQTQFEKAKAKLETMRTPL